MSQKDNSRWSETKLMKFVYVKEQCFCRKFPEIVKIGLHENGKAVQSFFKCGNCNTEFGFSYTAPAWVDRFKENKKNGNLLKEIKELGLQVEIL